MNAIVYALPIPQARNNELANVIPLPKKTKYGVQESFDFEWPRNYGSQALNYVAARLSPEGTDTFSVQPTSRSELPSAKQWSMRLVHAIVEVINGSRPHTQLNRWLTPEVMSQVQRHMRDGVRERLHVRSISVHETDDGVAEVCAVFGTTHRCYALAMRLEGLDGRWRATSFIWGM